MNLKLTQNADDYEIKILQTKNIVNKENLSETDVYYHYQLLNIYDIDKNKNVS